MAGEAKHPFIDNGLGYPTQESVRDALGAVSMGALADVPVQFRGEKGSMVDVIAKCPIEHLVDGWPKNFVARVIGVATQAAQG